MHFRLKYFLVFVFLFLSGNVLSQSYNAYIRAGDKAMLTGDYYSASTYFFRAIEFDNDEVELLYKMAEASRNFNDYINAAKFYQQTIIKDKQKEFPLATFWLARMKQYIGDYEAAKNLFNAYYFAYQSDNSYFINKSKAEAVNCDTAKYFINDSLLAEIKNLGAPVNTVYSDFAAQQLEDTVLYYSSLKFEIKDKKNKRKKKYVSRVLRARSENEKWKEPVAITGSINNQTSHNCNTSFSPDRKVMIFSRCNQAGATLKCDLYESKWDGNQWSNAVKLPAEINVAKFTSTQPNITANGVEGYTVYYVTNRPEGFGKLDIWKTNRSANGSYTKPENLGSVINTTDDDVSPYFNLSNQSLYFSSEGHVNLGGFDIFKSTFSGTNYSQPENIGYPLNTSYNEIYFTAIKDSSYLFSSNRPGSMFIKARTCCYDIYEAKLFPKKKIIIPPKDTAIVPVALTVVDTTYERNIFLKLYFDNDMPDRRTMQTTTISNYEDLFLDYANERDSYLKNFAAGLTDTNITIAEKSIKDFFDNNVESGFKGLEKFSAFVLKLLNEDKEVELKVRGSASPLANSNYNTNLSKRRIVSIINYWKSFNAGAINIYLKSGKLKITEDPVGENLAEKGLSDNLRDKRNSVYHPLVARERYIEVIKFVVNGEEKK